MKLELAQLVTAWPFGASLAAVVAMRGRRVSRRRSALNEALHELRRPLQALALSVPGGAGPVPPAALEGAVQMAASALARLEREINGEPALSVRAPVSVRPLLGSAVARWQAQAELAGTEISLRWGAGLAVVDGDRCELAEALDNLIVNAIEHGGPEIVVEAEVAGGCLRLAVIDSGGAAPLGSRRRGGAGLLARITGRARRGHGLRIVSRIAVAHGGEFKLRRAEPATEAVLELPLSPRRRGGGA